MLLSRSRTWGIAACAVLTAFLVLPAACGGNGDETPSPTPTPTAPITVAPVTPAPEVTVTPTATPTPTPEPVPEEPPPATAPPIPTPVPGVPEVVLTIVVNKEHALPDRYIPPQLRWIPREFVIPGGSDMLLRSDTLDAWAELAAAALADGHDIRIRSAYRSYEEQAWTFNYWIDVYGEQEARRRSAPPGHSEHQLGTTIDVTTADVAWELDQQFHMTPGGAWLMEHAHEYGFALSYPEGGEAITGYIHEPWHWRYIGIDAARAWHASGLTLVEFLKATE
jgi:zinc D-Ala-D-Ala carboxypeptidase